MKKVKPVKAQTARDVFKALGLSPAQGAELTFRSELNTQIINIVKKKRITHTQLAKLAQSSQTRITALLNRNTSDISTDLMLRVVAALGYQAKVRVTKVA